MRKLCRIIFSRYAVSALAILLELVLYSLLLSNLANLSPFWLILILLSHVSAVIAIINRNVNPEYKVSWIIVVTVLPIFGLVLYVVFYRRRMSRKDGGGFQRACQGVSRRGGKGDGDPLGRLSCRRLRRHLLPHLSRRRGYVPCHADRSPPSRTLYFP